MAPSIDALSGALMFATGLLVASALPLMVLQFASKIIDDMATKAPMNDAMAAIQPMLAAISTAFKKIGISKSAKIGLQHVLLMATVVMLVLVYDKLSGGGASEGEDAPAAKPKLMRKRRPNEKKIE